MTRRADNRNLYRLISVLFAGALSFQAAYSIGSLERLRHAGERAARPFSSQTDTNLLTDLDPALTQAGVRDGDQLLALDGTPYRGAAGAVRILASKRPGDAVAVQALRSGRAQAETFSVPLRAIETRPMSVWAWLSWTALAAATPLACLALGFGVLAARPRDPLAWLLLAMMLSFAQLSIAGGATFEVLYLWPDAIRPVAIGYHALFIGAWSIWMLLFGIYFPERLGLDRRMPWLKWLLIAPIGAAALGNALMYAGDAENYRLFAPLRAPMEPLSRASFLFGITAVWGFFGTIWTKIHAASSADARRRLVLLVNGAGLALMPLFLLAIGQVFGAAWTRNELIWAPCVLMLGLFPLTLAYVIVVQRALDVRVVLRQSLRYALAARGIRFLQAAFVAALVITAWEFLSDPTRKQAQKLIVVAVGVPILLRVRSVADWLRAWLDRRFFREAYKTEQILSELSEKVRSIVETRPLLKTVADQISASLHVSRVAMLIEGKGVYQPAYAVGYSEPPDTVFGEKDAIIAQLKSRREPLRVYFDDPESWLYRDREMTDGERAQLQRLNPELLLPLAHKEKLMGFISLGAKRSEEPYSGTDVQLLESVAAQAGLALENSHLTEAIASEVAQRERLNRELEIAREVQERLFPQSYPSTEGMDLAGRCRPASGVGGDYYDFLELPDGGLGIAIGDVSGKGIPAALLMASLQASLRGQTIGGAKDLAAMMGNINRLIFNTTPANRYATFFYAQYQPRCGRLTYVNGGHNPPLLFRGAEVIRLETGGPVVGLFASASYEQAAADMQPGDALVLFTDGISEAMNAADDEWGEESLIETVRACMDRPASEMIERLMAGADAFAAGAPQHDDMTAMVVKVSR